MQLPRDRVPQLQEVNERLAASLTGFQRAAGGRSGAGARLLRRAGGSHVLRHAVRPPSLRALLHTRAGRHPRADRARVHAGIERRSPISTSWRAQRPGARHRTRRSSSSRGCSGSPSSSVSCGRTANCGPTAPACSRPTASSTCSAEPSVHAWDVHAMGDHRVRHHEVPALDLRRGVGGRARLAISVRSSRPTTRTRTESRDSWRARSTAACCRAPVTRLPAAPRPRSPRYRSRNRIVIQSATVRSSGSLRANS